MSTGDAPINDQLGTTHDLDDSSSESIFNRSSLQQVSCEPINPISSEQISFGIKTMQPDLNIILTNQQHEITNLHKNIHDIYNELHHLNLVVHSASQTPIPPSRPDSTHNYHHYENRPHYYINPCTSSSHILHPRDITTSLPVTTTSLQHNNTVAGADPIRHLQEILSETKAALELRETEIKNLKKRNDELLHFHSISGISPSNTNAPSAYSPSLPSEPQSTSAFTPVISSPKSQPFALSTNLPTTTSTSFMPFTISLTNTLPNFSGKEGEMPTKFITEFEIRASGLFGSNDDYLLRAVQQVLSDSALTWFVQTQQEQSVLTWIQFKQLFLRRFRTPEKIELFRGRLRTLCQGDTESTADYYERLKSLMAEIDPSTSNDYLKRKFLQKLRKDIRDKMTLGLTSNLSDLVQKAVEIGSNIVQQKIDDKLRDIHKDDNVTKQKLTTVNNLQNPSSFNPSSTSPYYDLSSTDNNYPSSSKTRGFPSADVKNQPSRTFINSRHPSTPLHDESQLPRQGADRSMEEKPRAPTRWCSFCSSSSHTWFRCYSNPNGPNYQQRPIKSNQPQPHPTPLLPPYYRRAANPSNHQPHNPTSHSNATKPHDQSSQPSMPKNSPGSRY